MREGDRVAKQTMPKKDYAYRSTYKHQMSRARNLAQRGGMTKPQMMKRYGRHPKKHEWFGEDGSYAAWRDRWVREHPPPERARAE